MDIKFTFSAHVEQIISKAYKSLRFVKRKSKPFNPTDLHCLKVLYYSYIRSVLEFAGVILRPFLKTPRDLVESIQHKFMKHLNDKAQIKKLTYE